MPVWRGRKARSRPTDLRSLSLVKTPSGYPNQAFTRTLTLARNGLGGEMASPIIIDLGTMWASRGVSFLPLLDHITQVAPVNVLRYDEGSTSCLLDVPYLVSYAAKRDTHTNNPPKGATPWTRRSSRQRKRFPPDSRAS